MASSPHDKTYRVRGIPGDLTEYDTELLLSSIWDPSIENPKPRVHSLAPDPYSFGQDIFHVATVTFKQIPHSLLDSQDEWTLSVPGLKGPNEESKGLSLTIDSHFRGFTPLNSVKGHKIDCVAITGLSSHPFGSWKQRKGQHMWLRDSLPQDLQGARVLLYGYDTNLVQSQAFQDIDDIAITFSRSIRSVRRRHKVHNSGIAPSAQNHLNQGVGEITPRPLIFIAHSLGGLILKKAILQMKSGNEGDKDNFRSIYGALLFGVPNLGIRIEQWLPIVNGQPNENLVRNLAPGSKYLWNLGENFRSAFSFPDSEIISIYETERTRVAKEEEPGKWSLTGNYEVLVPVSSATDSPGIPIHHVLAIKKNHSDLVKFSSRWDENYRLIVTHLDDFGAAAARVIAARFSIEQDTAEIAQAMEKEDQLGLFELWPANPEDGSSNIKTRVDIVAIHGLSGDPYGTWTEGQRMWLRDFVPSAIPEARIMTYGYDSIAAFRGPASRISDPALDLMERLRAKKRKDEEKLAQKPIIFICHSLGGIILKKAFIIAHETASRYEPILKATTGVVFMGTPHHDADTAFWGDMLGKLADVLRLGSIQANLLAELETKSTLLGEICSQFLERARGLHIFSFYERLKAVGLEDLVVDQKSAILHLPKETPLPIESDHLGICKFLTANSQRYLVVQESLVELVEESEAQKEHSFPRSDLSEQRSKFLLALCEFDYASILHQITRNKGTTCQWILTYPEFTSWKSPNTPRVLWLYGLAGSGKSVLARYVINHLQGIISVNNKGQNEGNDTQEQSISYFFSSDKDARRRTTVSLLRSILFQILFQNNKFIRHIYDHQLIKPDDFISTPEALWDCLRRIFEKGRGTEFWIVIDALDELPETSRQEVLDGLRRIVTADLVGRVKLMLTDRQGPSAEYTKPIASDIQTIHLDIGPVWRDVETFISSEVQSFCSEHGFPRDLQKTLETELISRSQGIFLLASLNWANFSDNVAYWDRQSVNQRLLELRKLSPTLESLYCSLLRKVPYDFQTPLRRAFSWVMTAREPLTVTDLQYAISVRPSDVSYQMVRENLGFNFVSTLRRYCSQFFEIEDGDEVQFRHQSVKDLLTQRASLEANEEFLRQYRTSRTESEYEISIVCLTVLRWKEFSGSGAEMRIASKSDLLLKQLDEDFAKRVEKTLQCFPLLKYCTRNWSSHCESVRDNPRIINLIAKYIMSSNGNYFRLLTAPQMVESRRIRSNVLPNLFEHIPPLNSLVQHGDFASVAETLVGSGEDINELDSEGMTPLHWTLVRGRRETFDFLMRMPSLRPNTAHVRRDKPIHVCINSIFKDIYLFEKLLEDERVDVNATGHPYESNSEPMCALHLVMDDIASFEAWLDPLLRRKDIDLNVKDEKGLTPFIKALSTGYGKSAALKFLQKPSWALDIKVMDRNGTNALSLASIRGWMDVMKELSLRDRSQVFSADYDGMNALTRAAYFGQRTTLEQLLDNVSPDDVYRLANLGRYKLLNLCAQQDWEQLTYSLTTRFGLVSLEQDDKGRTLLHWAVEWGWAYGHADHSLPQRERINVQDRDGKTALHIAAECRNLKAARSLLGQGASFLVKDKTGRNAVHVAAESGARAVLELFLSAPDREFGRDNQGRSLLHFIVMWECDAVIRRYIASKRPIIDLIDKTRRTPLHYAAIFGNIEAATILLRRGAALGRKNILGFSPLHHAVQQGHGSVIELFLKHGANIRERDGFSRTNLQISISSGKLPIVDLILDQGASIRNRDKWGRTALHRAAFLANPRIIHELLEYGADINSPDSSGYTPLHLAVMAGNGVAVLALLTYKQINLSKKDALGCTSLDWALASREERIASTLSASGAVSTQNYKESLRLYSKPERKEEYWHDWPLVQGTEYPQTQNPPSTTPHENQSRSRNPPANIPHENQSRFRKGLGKWFHSLKE